MGNDKDLWEYDKFWVIWASCADVPRTIKDIQNLWKYEGNSLYQAGKKEPIWQEMIDEGFLEKRGRIKKRGVSGVLLYARFEWIPEYLEKLALSVKLKNANFLAADLLSGFNNRKKLLHFLEEKRTTFFFIENLKKLFGTKEFLRENGEFSVLAPLMFLLNIHVFSVMREKMHLKEDSLFILSQPVVFSFSFRVNFLEYFREVIKDIKPADVPTGLISNRKVFAVWRNYTAKLYENI